MGNDGGSIPDRRDLVKSKPKAEQADKNNQIIAAWFYCALSKRELREPVVSCELGKLYNKDAILEFLLDKKAYGDGERICGHIRSLKDVKTLKLTPNPIPSNDEDSSTRRHAQYICPLTMREMSGVVPFVYITTCGDVFSAAGLRSIVTTSSPPADSTPSSSTPSPPPPVESSPALDLCPQCGVKFSKTTDVRPINPTGDEQTKLLEAMLFRRAAAKKNKKRKAIDIAGPNNITLNKKIREMNAADNGIEAAGSVNANGSTAALVSKRVVAQLAEEEKKRKAGMSAAVASLYESKSKNVKHTFTTMNTFNRY